MRYLIHNLHRLVVPAMIFVVVISNCLSMTSAQFIGDDLKFPYQALVLKDGTAIHSGPGDVHYETDSLRQGETVEVYRHDPGGWCAIRPISGSFSLVPETTLQIVDEGVGQVIEAGTQAWVGTGLGPVEKPLWQVKLQKGELVEVLGQINWPNPEGHSSTWYQISPPAGEFRWIRMSEIQLPYSARMATLASQTSNYRIARQCAIAN